MARARRVSKRSRRAELIRSAFLRDLAEAEAFLRKRTAHLLRGPMGVLLNPLLSLFFSFLTEGRLRERQQRQMDLLLDVASVPDTELEDESRRRLDEFLRDDEIHQRANPGHPFYPRVRRFLEDFYYSRVTFMWSLLHAEGATFDELLRSAYPRRKGVEMLLADQLKALEGLLGLARKDPDLFRIPRPFRREVLQILSDAYRFSHGLMKRRLDEIYGNG